MCEASAELSHGDGSSLMGPGLGGSYQRNRKELPEVHLGLIAGSRVTIIHSPVMYTVENGIVHFLKSQNLSNSEADSCF